MTGYMRSMALNKVLHRSNGGELLLPVRELVKDKNRLLRDHF